MTRAALIIQNQYRTHREHERFKKSRRAAAIIQNTFRSYRERRRSTQRRREQRLSKRQEARYIQKASNRYLYRFVQGRIYTTSPYHSFIFFRLLGVFVPGCQTLTWMFFNEVIESYITSWCCVVTYWKKLSSQTHYDRAFLKLAHLY